MSIGSVRRPNDGEIEQTLTANGLSGDTYLVFSSMTGYIPASTA
jgi:hypothetical protein